MRGIVVESGGTMVKVLCYKSEGRWFEPSWYHWNFSLTKNPSDRTIALGSPQPLPPGNAPGTHSVRG